MTEKNVWQEKEQHLGFQSTKKGEVMGLNSAAAFVQGNLLLKKLWKDMNYSMKQIQKAEN